MTLFKTHGIHESPPARPRGYRRLRFGLTARPRTVARDIEAEVAACVRALTRVQPARWEDVLASYDRAA